MTKILRCHECKKGTLREVSGTYETVYVDRHGVEKPLLVPDIRWLKCDHCGEEILDDIAMAAIEDARRKAMGLLTSAEIRCYREQVGKSQKAMSEFLGVGEKSYCRWETGAYVQSEAIDRYLRLLFADLRNCELLERIAMEKVAIETSGRTSPWRANFEYLVDPARIAKRESVYLTLMSSGELLAA